MCVDFFLYNNYNMRCLYYNTALFQVMNGTNDNEIMPTVPSDELV